MRRRVCERRPSPSPKTAIKFKKKIVEYFFENVTVKISERQKQILSANFGLFLYKKPRKRPVLQAVTSFFAGDLFEDAGFLVFVQSIELTQLVGDGRVMFQLSKNEVEILWTKISSTKLSAKSRSCQRKLRRPKKCRRNVTVKIERFPEKFSILLNS